MRTQKYARLPFILKLFTDEILQPEPDTFELIADCFARMNDQVRSESFRAAATTLRQKSQDFDITDWTICENPVKFLENVIANGDEDFDLITSHDISMPVYIPPIVHANKMLVQVTIALETCPDVSIGDITQIEIMGETIIAPNALEEEKARKENLAKRLAAVNAVAKLRELVKTARESFASLSDNDNDIEHHSPNTDRRSKVQILSDLVNNAKGAYELVLSRERSQPRYRETDKVTPHFIQIELQLRLDVSPEIEIDLPDRLAALAERSVLSAAPKIVRQKTVKQLSNSVATTVLQQLEGIANQVRTAANARLAIDLEERLQSWRVLNQSKRYVGSFERVRKIVCDREWGGLYGARINTYGSMTSGQALPNSDLDVNVTLPVFKGEEANTRDGRTVSQRNADVLNYIARLADRAKMERVFLIDTAKVPVLHYWDPENRLDVDVTIGNPGGVLLTKFIRAHLMVDHRVWELSMIVKFWARQRGISGAPHGYINALGWTVMVIHFLQHRVVPPIAGLFAVLNSNSEHVSRDTCIKRVPWKRHSKLGKNPMKTADLVVQFFLYYAYQFEYDADSISLNADRPKARTESESNNNVSSAKSPIFVEQPLVRGENIVGYVSPISLRETCQELRRAHYTAENVGRVEVVFEAKE